MVSRWTRGHRLLLVAAGLVAVVVVIAAAKLTAPAPTSSASVAPLEPFVPAGPLAAVEGPQPPATGAWFGAWSKPVPLTQEGRIQAVQDVERLIGRNLDIVHTYRKWADPFPTQSDLVFLRQSILQLSWAGTDTASILAGSEDTVIRERARAVKAVDVPLLLEWRWEMDRPNLQAEIHSPTDYVAAWRHIRTIFRQEGVHNAGWVWCPLSQGFATGRAPAYYPGDGEVDWLCVDAYPTLTSDGGPTVQVDSMAQLLRPFLLWAADRPKPVLIGEFGVPQALEPNLRAAWLDAATQTFKAHPQIKGVVYYNENPEGNPAQYDYAIGSDRAVRQAFAAMASDSYFTTSTKPGS